MDDFKKYIRQRAEDMDVDLPRERVWLAVKQEVKPPKPKMALVYMKWAVAACVIALAGFGGFALLNKQEVKPVGIAAKPNTEIPAVAQNKQSTPDEQEEDVKIKGTGSIKPAADQCGGTARTYTDRPIVRAGERQRAVVQHG